MLLSNQRHVRIELSVDTLVLEHLSTMSSSVFIDALLDALSDLD